MIAYLARRGITELAFVAATHWHYRFYGGLILVINAMDRVGEVCLATDPSDTARPETKLLRRNLEVVHSLGEGRQMQSRHLPRGAAQSRR